MNRSEKFLAAAVQYGLSILSGIATFAGLNILQRSVSNDDLFSRLSILLLSFTTFQLIADLGTQTEFLRSYHHTEPRHRPALFHILIHSRLVLGFLVLFVAAIYSLTSNFSAPMSLSFLCYHLAFIPFAFISSMDSIFLARQEFTKAVLSRIARLLSLAAFVFAAIKIAPSNELIIPLASTLSFFIIAVFCWVRLLRPLMTNESRRGLLSKEWWTELGSGASRFIHGSGIAALVIGVVSAHGILSHSILVRTLGENQLTTLNSSIALATPAVLAFQTLVQFVSANVAGWTTLLRNELLQRYLTFFLRMTALLIIMLTGLWGARSLGLVSWFFPRATNAIYPLCQFIIVAQWVLNLATPGIILCQYQKRYKSILTVLTLSALTACVIQLWWIDLLQEYAYLMSLFLMGILPAIGGFIVSLRVQRSFQANS